MAPQSRGGPVPPGFQSKSTPNLPTLRSLDPSNDVSKREPLTATTPHPSSTLSPTVTSPSDSEPASIEDSLTLPSDDDPSVFNLHASSSSSSSVSGSDREEIPELPDTSRPLHTSRSYSHLPYHGSQLFPPFYNRPPTPLPPSPSLKSLLRPTFSAGPSRRTTPESSDADLPSGTGTPTSTATQLASIKKSALASTAPRASPKVPTYEYYGFALYLASSAVFLMYILWAYLPSPFLHQLGISYYPNRWWALAAPAWLVVLVLYIYVALASYNTQYLTLPLVSSENLVDEAGVVAAIDTRTKNIVKRTTASVKREQEASSVANGSDMAGTFRFRPDDEVNWKKIWSISTDGVLDIPIGGVCEVLYGDRQEDVR